MELLKVKLELIRKIEEYNYFLDLQKEKRRILNDIKSVIENYQQLGGSLRKFIDTYINIFPQDPHDKIYFIFNYYQLQSELNKNGYCQ